jgi:hypothetical protein
MKRFLSLLCILSLGIVFNHQIIAQENEQPPAEEQPQQDNRPVRGWFDGGQLIDNQTPVTPAKGALEMVIHHRFGNIKENKFDDLFGIYSSSNIRMGFNYGITDRIMIGIGTEKDRKLQELHWKYAIMQQTRSGSVPFSLSYYGNIALDARDKSFFTSTKIEYKYIHRLSYFSQFIFARKMSNVLSLQAAPTFIYFNSVDQKYSNYNVGLSAGGKIKVSQGLGVIFEYSQAYIESTYTDVNTNVEMHFSPKPNFGIGIEKGTATHCFQVFASNARSIINQYNMGMNEDDFFSGGICFGFNITVRF